MEILHVTPDAPWLPAGSRAEVIASEEAVTPVGLARLLIVSGGAIWCRPREGSGALDIPTRTVASGDGEAEAREMATGLRDLRPLGFVRNVVPSAGADYAWPTPVAHFRVWTAIGTPSGEGAWVPHGDLAARHWYPLFQRHHVSSGVTGS